jgi:crotonobetainyl-CoA:carnitine CoA-transferase CaiB-like acyl-CoA transferase
VSSEKEHVVVALPLEGVRIIDLTVVWAGPGATMHLGDLGAEVIRVESIYHFAPSTRGMLPYITKEQAAGAGYLASLYPDKDPGEHPYNRSALFNCNGRNKLSVTMPLERPEGREAFLALVAKSNVLIENNSARMLDRFGIGWDVLHEVNPQLIMVRMPALGLNGPFRDYLGFGTNFNALTGVVAFDGYHDGDLTTGTSNLMMDEISSTGGALAVLTALYAQKRDGKGRFVEYAQAEAVAQTVGEYVLDVQVNGRVPGLSGNRHPYLYQGVYPTADGQWLALTLRDDRDWSILKWIMGNPPWADKPGYAQVSGRLERQDELDAGIASYTSAHDWSPLFVHLQAEGLAAGPVMLPSMVRADPQVADRGYYHSMTHPECGTHDYPGFAWKSSAMALKMDRAAPCLGQDNEYIYREVLGYSQERYQKLIDDEVIGTELRVGR